MSEDSRSRRIVAWTSLIARKVDAFDALPHPVGEPSVVVAGSDPDRILMVGSGIMVGTGVFTHSQGIAGHLARDIAAATHRGITVDIFPIPGLLLRHTTGHLAALNLNSYDAVVLAVGLNDALIFTSRAEWRRALVQTIATISELMPPRGHTFIITIADPTQSPLFRRIPARIAAARADALNTRTRQLTANQSAVTLISFELGPPENTARPYDRNSYKRWSSQLAPEIIAGLNRIRAAS